MMGNRNTQCPHLSGFAGVAQLAEQLICNQQVAGSSPITSSIMGEFPSGQRGQTVNLLLFSFGGPNPPSPTKQKQTIFLMVCFCLGRVDNRTIFAQQKHGSPKRRKKKLFPTVKSRASNELREPHQRSQFGEAQRTHPRPYRFNQFHLFNGLFLFGAGG